VYGFTVGHASFFQMWYPFTTNQNQQLSSSSQDNEFLENASRKGADRVRTLSIEERTKRAMLAEAVEDRMVLLSEQLEELLGEDGLPKKVEFRKEVEILAKQIKESRMEYKALVTGDESSMLNALDILKKLGDE
jgi:hypothetical protein